MPSIYALDSVVDLFGAERVGRLVYRYTTNQRVKGRTTFCQQYEDWRLIEPHRRHWLGRKTPKLVRIQYTQEGFSYFVYYWRQGRASWCDATNLQPAGWISNRKLILQRGLRNRAIQLQIPFERR